MKKLRSKHAETQRILNNHVLGDALVALPTRVLWRQSRKRRWRASCAGSPQKRAAAPLCIEAKAGRNRFAAEHATATTFHVRLPKVFYGSVIEIVAREYG